MNYASEHSVREERGRRERNLHLVMAYGPLTLNKVIFPYVKFNICMH